jgi:MoaA/NifB/PqqE/SkfB family radical SAM enzyme
MDFDLFKDIVNQTCASAPIRQICLVGFGEPLLYPRLEEAIQFIKNKNHAIRTTITTNGVLLSSEWAHRLVSAGLDQITISVNATSKEQYKEINRADLYENVVSNTSVFLETVNILSPSMRVLVQILEGPNGMNEIKAFSDFWKPKLGRCGEVQVQPFVNWAGLINNTHNVSDNKDKHYPCAHIQCSWIITREGNALACCMVSPGDEGDLFLGSVKEKSLKELYMEGRILELRKMNLEGTLYKLSPCNKCDSYKTVPNVWIKNPLYPYFGKQWL